MITKYDIEGIVWAMRNNKPTQLYVRKIEIKQHVEGVAKVITNNYFVSTLDHELPTCLPEKLIFPSKEELVKSL